MPEPDIASFLASRTPRDVPGAVRKRAKAGLGRLLIPLIFGAAFAGFGMLFVTVFFPGALLQELSLDFGEPVSAAGRITAVEDANMSVNEQKVWRYRFAFTDARGNGHAGACYRTGSGWNEGDEVSVEYLEDSPEAARISGTSLNAGGYFGLFTLIFPLAGLGIMGGSLWTWRRKLGLLKNGLVAEGQVKEVRRTNTQVNYKQVFKIIFDYEAQDGRRHEGSLRTHDDDLIWLATKRREAQQPVFLLYDQQKPKRVLLAEALFEPASQN